MRWLGWVAAGVVLGFLLGGVAPRRDLAALQAELAAAREELARAPRGGGRRGSALPVPGMDAIFDAGGGSASAPAGGDAPDPEEGGDAIVGQPGPDGGVPADPAPAPADFTSEYNVAVDAQRMRASQSRAALEEQADLSEEELEAFDAIVSDMNAELAQYGEDLMALALAGEEPDAEEMLGLTHEVTGILYDAQAAVNDLVGVDAMAEVDPSARQVWNHVDLEVFRGAVEDMAAGEGGGGAPGGRR